MIPPSGEDSLHRSAAPTFRDPAGSIHMEGDFAVRTIHPAAREQVLAFLDSPLRQRLEARGDMVATTVEDSPSGLRLLHPRIAVPSYPWEWTPGQWLAAAKLTLSLCDEALTDGWILKDATPLNILFAGPRPVLVDVLSFEPLASGNSTWLAYAQYVRTFLLPLVMLRLLRWPLALTLFHRDGYEPAELYATLSWPQRLSRAALVHITLPALLEKRSNRQETGCSRSGFSDLGAVPTRSSTSKDPGLALHILRRTLASLRRRTQRAVPRSSASQWSGYNASLTHYTAEETAAKLAFVRDALEEFRPARVLDVGANTGEFSALAASLGAGVIALERDATSAERTFVLSHERSLDILTLHADLARPTPAAGWENAESAALLPRLEQQADMVLLLAVIHHLLLMEQIPLPAILALLHRLTRRHLLLEWVPPGDPMFQSLLRGRDSLYGALSEDALLAACAGLFRTVRRETLTNGRVLFLMERVPA
jgi:SAM-dependent methyltransferase